MHGLVLKSSDVEYSDLSKFGRIVIEHGPAGVSIVAEGFEFHAAGSCRQDLAKAMAWGRDVLAVQVEAARLVPGATITSAVDEA